MFDRPGLRWLLGALVLAVGAVAHAPRADAVSRARSVCAGQRMSGQEPRAPLGAPQTASLAARFEENRGQAGDGVDYVVRCRGYLALLGAAECVLAWPAGDTPGGVLRLSFPGADPGADPAAEARPGPLLPGVSHYLRGTDPDAWVRHVPSRSGVSYAGVHEGVDVTWGDARGRLAFELDLARADLVDGVGLRLDGADSIEIDATGRLAARVGEHLVHLSPPRAFQGGSPVAIEYALVGDDDVRFELGPHDPGRPLLIDPEVTLSTYHGGAGADAVTAADDADGNVYVGGRTTSTDFVTTTGSFQTTLAASVDGFVTKLSSSGEIVYSTYLGGTLEDVVNAIAVDEAGRACVGGSTQSTDFPLQSAYETTPPAASQTEGWVAKLEADGADLVFSSYTTFGFPVRLGLDRAEDIYAMVGRRRMKVAKVKGDGSGEVWVSSYDGPFDNGLLTQKDMAVTDAGDVWVVGETTAPGDFALGPAYQTTYAGNTDGMLIRLDEDGVRRYQSYFGGSDFDEILAVAVDDDGNVQFAGQTSSTDFPTKDAEQATKAGARDVFFARLDWDDETLLYGTYLGGEFNDVPRAMALGSCGDAYIVGDTASTDFPTRAAVQDTHGGDVYDAFVVKYDPAGAREYSTFVGGSNSDAATGLALDIAERVALVGFTPSTDFPLESELDATLGGVADAFIVYIADDDPALTMTPPTLVDATVGAPLSVTFTPGGGTGPYEWLSFDDTLPPGLTLSSAGVLSGTPTVAGDYRIRMHLGDDNDLCTGFKRDLFVFPAPGVVTSSLPPWTEGRPYSQTLVATGGRGALTWSLGAGALPAGMTIGESSGVLDGTPAAAGTYDFTVQVSDVNLSNATRDLQLVVNALPSITTASQLPECTEARPYEVQFASAGGTAPVTWSVASGVLPVFDDIDAATGALAGATRPAAQYAATLRIEDAAGATAERTFDATINPRPTILAQELGFAVLGRPYETTFTHSGGTGAPTWSFVTGWPGGIDLDAATGAYAGIPRLPGPYAVVIGVADECGGVHERLFGMEVVPIVDLERRRAREEMPYPVAPVVRALELVAGTRLTVAVRLLGKGKLEGELALVRADGVAVDLSDVLRSRGRWIRARRVWISRSDRYFVTFTPSERLDPAIRLDVLAAPPGRWPDKVDPDPGAETFPVRFSAVPGSRATISVAPQRRSAARPTIEALLDEDGNDLLVLKERRERRKSATLRMRTPLDGGDYTVVVRLRDGFEGLVRSTVKLRAPRGGYGFALEDQPAGPVSGD